MVKVERKKRHLSPTTRFISQEPGQEGRLTADGFRLMKDLAEFISLIEIEDGEITTDKIAVGAVTAGKITVTSLEDISEFLGNVAVHGNLVVGGTITTGKVAMNAISELTALIQPVTVGPHGSTILSGTVPVSGTNTGLLLTFTGFMDKPTSDPANSGYWTITLNRNGTPIATTPLLFYDDNFSYQPVASFIDPTPGANPTYSLTTALHGGLGNFEIKGGVLNVGLLKR